MVQKLALPALFSALALAITCGASPAQAGLQFKLQSDGETYTQAGASPLVVTHSVGNFTTTVNTGTTTSTPALDISSVDISSSGGGTLVVTLSETGLTNPFGAANWLSQFSGNFFTGSATVTQQTYLDNTNTLFGTGTLLTTQTASTTPFSLAEVTSGTTTGPFSLTEILTIVTKSDAGLSLDASVTYVPEPASLTLLASAVVGVCSLARRKRNA